MAADAVFFDEADLNAFADGRLEPARAAALAESLASDRLARARIDGWKRQNEGVRTLFASVLFEPVPVRLLPATLAGTWDAATPLSPPDRAATRGGSSGARSGTVLAMTTLGVALVGFLAGALATLATDGFGHIAGQARNADSRLAAAPSTFAERAAQTYRAALSDPGSAGDFAAGDQAKLQHWMIRQLSGAARIPDLRPQGWKLLGGRVVSGRYAPAIFLTYGQGAERIGLYVAREPLRAAERTTSSADGIVTVSSWSQDGLGTALASTRDIRASEDAVESVRDAIRRQMNGNLDEP